MSVRQVSDIASIVMGQSPAGETCNTIGAGLPLLNGPTEFGHRHPTPVQFTEDARKFAQTDDLLFCVRGSTTGRMNWADQKYAIGRGIAAIRHNRGAELQPLLRAVIESQLPSLLQTATGSTFPNVSATQLAQLSYPDLTQDVEIAIASLLGALEGKIAINRRMNDTLESIVRTVFKDWFVDFGPTRAKAEGQASYLGADIWSLFPACFDAEGTPEGWYTVSIDQIARFLNGLALQKYPAKDDEAYLPVIKIAQLRAATVVNSDRASFDIPREYIVEDGDVLFSWSGSLLHRVWTSGRGALNQHLFKVTSDKFPKWFYYYWIDQHMEDFRAIASSKATTMGHIQRHHLTQAMTIVPPEPVINAANALISPLFERRIANDLESRTLTQTRDLLLPKLMSGEIRISDAEKFVENVS